MKRYSYLLSLFLFISVNSTVLAEEKVGIWMCYETSFQSPKQYDNPLYDVKKFVVHFKSASGRVKIINGFWDDGTDWKVRFCPDEIGSWTFQTECSDQTNSGLHNITGSFECVANKSKLDIYRKGVIVHPKGAYHLTYANGEPFFWTACTAWNGALKSTDEEWHKYLKHRADHGYNIIQFVTTQWRGCNLSSLGQVAFTGSGKISLDVDFFKHLDSKINLINEYGLVAAPVLLWALPFGDGMELSPGYYLPNREAILLSKYMVARYGGHHVIWILGGDGKYVDELEARWKYIGQQVFGEAHPGLVTTHPMGRSWIGNAYADQDWLDIIGYQSSHSNEQPTVDWINKGPVSKFWDKLPPKPYINMEPNYEEIHFTITDRDVRNACYWSIFAAPIAGITYGANGIWPWLRQGEQILNHSDKPGTSLWDKSIDFPGSIQIGYLAKFIRKLDWWRFIPAPEILVHQPGNAIFNHFISIMKTENHDAIIAYLPVQTTIEIYNPQNLQYKGEWFNPVTNKILNANIITKPGQLKLVSPIEGDMILLLTKEK